VRARRSWKKESKRFRYGRGEYYEGEDENDAEWKENF